MDHPKATYSQDEVNEILRRALEAQARKQRDFDARDLAEIAREAGIEEASLAEATAALARDRAAAEARAEEARALSAERSVQMRRLGGMVATHAVLNAVLYVVATQVTNGTWYVWPMLGSAIAIGLRIRHVLFPARQLARRRRREERRQRIAELKRVSSERGKEFERIVESGVSALLDLAARKLKDIDKRQKP